MKQGTPALGLELQSDLRPRQEATRSPFVVLLERVRWLLEKNEIHQNHLIILVRNLLYILLQVLNCSLTGVFCLVSYSNLCFVTYLKPNQLSC